MHNLLNHTPSLFSFFNFETIPFNRLVSKLLSTKFANNPNVRICSPFAQCWSLNSAPAKIASAEINKRLFIILPINWLLIMLNLVMLLRC